MYESFYHLRAKPFRLSPDPGFFFASRGHKRALAYLRYGLSQGEGFVVITGAPGTGKTTLAQILLREMGQSDVVVAHLTTTQLEADDMLRMVAASFGLRFEGLDKAGLLKTLEAFLLARSRERKRALLVIDEAQNLPAKSIEELRMLSNLQVGDKALLQTFLLGQAQFRQMLEHPDLEQLRQRVIANYHLSSLAADEVQSYIENRLTHVGWKGDPHFTEEAYQIIHSYTEGVPRRINMLCDRVMLFGSLEERHEINEDILRQVTDELQQEVSGRPMAPVDASDLLKETSAREEQDSAHTDGVNQVNEEVLLAETPKAEETEDVLSADPSTEWAKVDLPDDQEEQRNAASLEPEPEMLDRAEPDETWQRSYPKPDRAENHQDIEIKVQEKERFRVIPGGKGGVTPSNEEVEDTPSLTEIAANTNVGGMSPPNEPEDVVLRKILRLVLAFHRSPRSFPGLDDPSQPLPKGIRQILQLAVSDDQVLLDLRQIAVMGISPAMMRAAVRFFVRRVLFLPGGDDYRALGLPSGASTAEIEVHYGLLMRLMRQEKQQPGEEGGVSRIGEAYERLCHSDVVAPGGNGPEKELGDIEDIEELDLDLAPNMGSAGGHAKTSGFLGAGGSSIVTDDSKGNSKLLLRNAVLVAGAAVIVFVLYLTQIRTLEGPENHATDVSTRIQPDTGTPPTSAKAENEDREQAETTDSFPSEPVKNVAEGVGKDLNVTAETIEDNALPPETTEKLSSQPVEQAQDNSAALMAEIRERMQAEAESKSQEERETAAKAKAQAEAKLKAEEEARAAAEARAKAELQARIEAEKRAKAEEQARLEAEARAAALEAQAKAEAQARAETQARAEAEAKAKIEAQAEAEKARSKLAMEGSSPALAAGPMNSEQSSSNVVSEKPLSKPEVAAAAVDSVAEYNKVIERFKAAYESGDIAAVMGLFAQQARTNDQADSNGIRAEYQQLFGNTDQRQINFQGVKWEKETGYARGIGTYEVMIRTKKDQKISKLQGKLTLQLDTSGKNLQISRFYFEESRESAGAGNGGAASNTPRTDELNRIIKEFLGAYESGDINKLMALFAADAQTNDQSTIEGIRGDYAALFKNTTSRKMTLKNFHWNIDGPVARGDGQYTVEVKNQGRPAANVSGNLWIQTEYRAGKVLITHLAFLE